MPKVAPKDLDEALVRRHGKEGAWYLEHLRESSTNPFLQRVIADLEQEAEEAGGESSADSGQDQRPGRATSK